MKSKRTHLGVSANFGTMLDRHLKFRRVVERVGLAF